MKTATIILLAAALTRLAPARAPQAAAQDAPLNMTPAEVSALAEECGRRTAAMFRFRIYNYAYTQTYVEYELDKRGLVKGQSSKSYEVFNAVVGGVSRLIQVQVAEDGVAFDAEKVERGRARAVKELAEAEASAPAPQADAPNPETRPQAAAKPRLWSEGIKVWVHGFGFRDRSHWWVRPTDFFEGHEFYAPRRVVFEGRRAILLNFRPRADYAYNAGVARDAEGFKEFSRVLAGLGGRVWIDEADRVVAKLEAVPAAELSGRAAAGDGPVSDAPLGFRFVRLREGVWVPSLFWFDSRGREAFFWKTAARRAVEYTDFKRFRTSVEGEKLDPPRQPPR